MSYFRTYFNFICYSVQQIFRAIVIALVFITCPIWIFPIAMLESFQVSDDVDLDVRHGRKWWFKSWNKSPNTPSGKDADE